MDEWGHWWNGTDKGKRSNWIISGATLSIINGKSTEHVVLDYDMDTLIGAIPKYFHTDSKKHNNFIFKHVDKAISFDLQSHHRAILNRISIGILSDSSHLWDPKMFTLIKIVGIKVIVAIKCQ